MRNILKKVRDKNSSFFGYRVMETFVPEFPDVCCWICRDVRCVYINKGARVGANVVRLS